jgi:hypothetical protein
VEFKVIGVVVAGSGEFEEEVAVVARCGRFGEEGTTMEECAEPTGHGHWRERAEGDEVSASGMKTTVGIAGLAEVGHPTHPMHGPRPAHLGRRGEVA